MPYTGEVVYTSGLVVEFSGTFSGVDYGNLVEKLELTSHRKQLYIQSVLISLLMAFSHTSWPKSIFLLLQEMLYFCSYAFQI